MILASRGAPAVIAHRGGAGYAPENTLAAFRRTLERGTAQWMEFDVQRSQDGELVVFHDADLSRTTDVRSVYPERAGAGIGAFTAAELSRLDAGSWFDAGRFAGETIPTLSETLALLGDTGGILLELKNARLYPGIERQVAETLRRHGLERSPRLSIWSFELDALERFHAEMPAVATGAFGRTVRDLQQATPPGLLSAVGTWPEFSEEDLRLARREETPIVATTLDSIPRMRLALERGVDGVVTDYPDVLHAIIGGAEPFSTHGQLIVDQVHGASPSNGRRAVIRNAGAETVELAGCYLRHGTVTPLPERELHPAQGVEVPFSLNDRDAARDCLLPLALHDREHRLLDIIEF